jgi:hypothetical protein
MFEGDDFELLKDMESIIDAKMEEDTKITEFANAKNVIMLAFIGSYVPKRYNPSTSASASMNIRDEFGIEKVITEIKQKKSDCKKCKVYFLINSLGGNLSSAYKIARVIRDSFDDITVFVPHYALSGGTLLSLTGNKIRMGMMSQLSPLDVQLYYNNQQVSVNSLLRAKDKLDTIFATNKPEELPYTFQHMADGIDPIIFEEWTAIQQEGRFYLKEILKKSGYDDKATSKLLDSLTLEFPTHGFVINFDHAKQLGLAVEPFDIDIKEWNIMRAWLARYIVKQTDRHFIRYVIPSVDTNQLKNSDEVNTSTE